MFGSWKKHFQLEKCTYRLRKAFGNILIGENLKDYTLKLLELGGKQSKSIITEMALGAIGSLHYYLDTVSEESNFILIYQTESRIFEWKKFDRQN